MTRWYSHCEPVRRLVWQSALMTGLPRRACALLAMTNIGVIARLRQEPRQSRFLLPQSASLTAPSEREPWRMRCQTSGDPVGDGVPDVPRGKTRQAGCRGRQPMQTRTALPAMRKTPSPRGEGGRAQRGRMRWKKGRRWTPHQSPAATASPQGEAFYACRTALPASPVPTCIFPRTILQ